MQYSKDNIIERKIENIYNEDITYSTSYPTLNYLLKFNNGNTRTMCKICSKLS